MPVEVLIPTPLRKFCNECETVTVGPGTISTLVAELDIRCPGIQARITDKSGELSRYLNIYVNEEDIRFLAGKDTPVKDGDSVSIVPAIAGG